LRERILTNDGQRAIINGQHAITRNYKMHMTATRTDKIGRNKASKKENKL